MTELQENVESLLAQFCCRESGQTASCSLHTPYSC